MIIKILSFFGALALFLYGMRMLSTGFQKVLGKGTRKFLPMLTSEKRFMNAAGGFGLAAALWSSHTATLMVVNFVNSGLMSVRKAISSVMGANVATPLTVLLIAFLQFTCGIGNYAYIIVAAGFLIKGKQKEIGQMLIGTGLAFISLGFVQSSAEYLYDNPGISAALDAFGSHGFLSTLGFTLLGIIFAAVFQSSNATILMGLILMNMGCISFDSAFGIVIGANIGTTLQSNISVSNASEEAVIAARTHLLFNSLMAIVMLLIFRPFSFLLEAIPSATYGICLAHILFNAIGAAIFIWFVDAIAKAVVKEKIAPSGEARENFRLKYITEGNVGTPALSISLAYREAVNFGTVCYEGFSYIPMALNEKMTENFEHARRKLVEYEEITDKMESEIARFLGSFNSDDLTEAENQEIKILYRVIGELESLGDSGENISRLLQRTNVHNIRFDSPTTERLNNMITLVERAYSVMNANLASVGTEGFSIEEATKAEEAINALRDRYREEAINSLESSTGNYQSINYFLDLLSEFEAMGDFIINISQSLDRQFR